MSPLQARLWSRRWVELYLYSSVTAAIEECEWSEARPGRILPPGKTRYPLYRRLGGPQGRSGRAKNLAPTGFRSPDRPAPSSVAIPTELLGPHYKSRGRIINVPQHCLQLHLYTCQRNFMFLDSLA